MGSVAGEKVFVCFHAVVQESLRFLRDKDTPLDVFRFHSDRVCRFLFAEAIQDLPTKVVTVTTPLSQAKARIVDRAVVVVPILRAGLAMLPGALQALPEAVVGVAGLKRDEETVQAHEYYWNLPQLTNKTTIIITDPMLATGGTIYHTIKKLVKQVGPEQIRVVCVVAAPEGIKKVHDEFPTVNIFTAAVDQGLNNKAYIVPGLGDYGDRYMGT